eukprot:UN24245
MIFSTRANLYRWRKKSQGNPYISLSFIFCFETQRETSKNFQRLSSCFDSHHTL